MTSLKQWIAYLALRLGLAVLVAWHRLYIQRSVTVPESRAPRLVEILSPAAHKSVS